MHIGQMCVMIFGNMQESRGRHVCGTYDVSEEKRMLECNKYTHDESEILAIK